jgi:ABC-type spermidine/putrescine transport system permease subunit I
MATFPTGARRGGCSLFASCYQRVGGLNALLLAPSLLLLLIFMGIPLTIIAIESLKPNVLLTFNAPDFDNYKYLLSRNYYLNVLYRTIALAVLTAVMTVPLGFLTAMALPALPERIKNLALMGLTFPILAGPLVIILGWMAILPDGGPLFGPLVQAGLIDPPHILGSDAAVLISLIQFTLPFAVLTLYAALKEIPNELYEAASNLGAGALRRFLHVTFPLSLTGVLSSTIIVFSLAASSFISPHYLGGAADLMLTTLITQFVLATYNTPLASASAVLLLAVKLVSVLALVLLVRRFIRS